MGQFLLFDPQGTIALQERHLIIVAVLIMLAVVIPVFVVLFTFARKYRAGNPHAKYSPKLDHNRVVAVIFWGILVTVIGTLSIMNWNTTHALDPYRPLDAGGAAGQTIRPFTIQVVALQWKFLFIYPEQGIATVNMLEFPVGTPLHFELTAEGPMSSFWIPQLGSQIAAMPAMTTQLNLMANTVGNFPGMDTEINGAGFSGMKFMAHSVSQSDFDNWVQAVKQASTTLNVNDYNQLAAPSENNPPVSYASVDPNLYNSIIDKYMAAPGAPNRQTMPGMQM